MSSTVACTELACGAQAFRAKRKASWLALREWEAVAEEAHLRAIRIRYGSRACTGRPSTAMLPAGNRSPPPTHHNLPKGSAALDVACARVERSKARSTVSDARVENRYFRYYTTLPSPLSLTSSICSITPLKYHHLIVFENSFSRV